MDTDLNTPIFWLNVMKSKEEKIQQFLTVHLVHCVYRPKDVVLFVIRRRKAKYKTAGAENDNNNRRTEK